MNRTLVLNVVGLTPSLVGEHTPALAAFARRGALRPLTTVLPAVTCSVQSTFTTGLAPSGHGCVGNGWYFRDLAEINFWRQSNHLVSGEKIWDAAKRRDPSFTCAKLFWWWNMYSTADLAVTPRPMYPADGRKLPDVHTRPAGLRDHLQGRHGQFPLFEFWGPRAGIAASRWIARAALDVWHEHKPTLSLVYLPHLDYDLQRQGPAGPGIPAALREIDAVCGELIDVATRDGAHVIVLSEYGITPVTQAIHPNRVLRAAGLLAVRDEQGRELLDPGASRAFAVADHQVAHIYVNDPAVLGEVRALVTAIPGVETVLDADGKRAAGLDHPRAGELVCVSAADRWFSYYYWTDDDRAPDFARTVDIHRKPGYDPVELFLDPSLALPAASVGWKLARRKLGFRTLLDVIPLDTRLVKGSHGRLTDRPDDGPLVISSEPGLLADGAIPATAIKQLVLDHVFAPRSDRPPAAKPGA
ncbi:MAG TPA: nucleotide pyrophosphatase/phosphodiesterase family protein [Kofleriaceae bacterium]|jgi:predicted AlkP superfamily pyrophosphatase or phosphodiesterase